MGIFSTPLRPAIAATAVAAALLLAGCAPAATEAGGPVPSAAPAPAPASAAETTAALTELGLDAADGVALTEGLEALPVAGRTGELTAAIMPGEVRIQPDTPGELVVPIPDDQFYLSIAPYRTQTHDCTFHVPTSCLGELREADASIRVTDAASGEVIVDRAARTADNGFVGVWLPRDGEFVVEVTVGEDTGTQTVRTGANDPTCLTTLQVS